MIWHNSTINEVAEELGTDISRGLSSAEAEKRIEKYGLNEFKTDKDNSLLGYFLTDIKEFHNIALAVISVIYFILTTALGLDNKYESLVILSILFISVTINSLLKYFTDLQLTKVKKHNNSKSTVIRDGEEKVISSAEIVPGDILVIKTGDYIRVDGRLIDSYALALEEFLLTGETAPAEKHHDVLHEDITPIINRQNMIYCGSTVLNGRGLVLVTETGINTEIGMRKDMHRQVDNSETVLTEKLSKIHKNSSYAVLACSLLVFLLGVVVNFTDTSTSFAVTVAHNLLLCSSLFVACSPSIIGFFVKLSRSAAERKLKKSDITLSHRRTAEELKEVTVLCVDKTGTLTTEELTLTKIYNSSKIINLTERSCDDTSKALLRLALICSNFSKTEHIERHTNNMEKAIEAACINHVGMSKADIDGLFPKLAELPFDSERMLMTTVTAISGNPVAVIKGAPETIIPRCENVDLDAVQNIATNFAKEGLKVIAVAVKPLSEIPANPNSEELEFELNFAGILGFEDRIEDQTADLCKECAEAGIKTVMVTGDHYDTAVAVGIKAGLISDESEALNGEQISALSDKELVETTKKCSVFARITPEDKLRIVRAYKASGERVLVTGDSLSDAMALIEADFGCALGKTASDMIRESADIVIGDNKYSSLVYSIKESTNVFSSIKKALLYILSLQTVLATVMIFGLIVFGDALVSSAALMILSLITLALPIIAFFAEDAKENIHLSLKENKVFNKVFLLKLMIPSLLIALIALVAYGTISLFDAAAAKACVFSVIGIGEIIASISISRFKTIFTSKFLGFRSVLFAAFIGLLVTLILSLLPLGTVLGFGTLNGIGIIFVLITTLAAIAAWEVIKLFTNK